MSVSLDGYVAPADRSTDWIAAGGSDDAPSWTVETVSNAGAYLMGATTYAVMAAHWPSAAGPFTRPINEIPKVVFSDSLESVDWARRRSPPETWPKPSRGSSKSAPADTWSPTAGPWFARSLIETGLIDEYRLLIHPAILGAGERIFLAAHP